ncbi:hypothetical protein [Micromonospora musae]|uniref:hypothetical protein n=1 Tax=Micromonospora musae TaxID=1894970 RepID=UPI003403F2B5
MSTDLDVAQTATIASVVLTVALVAVLGFVALGFYRTRRSAAGAAQYQALAERAADAEIKTAEAVRSTATELKALRSDLGATRDELAEVKQRLGELERLLSQIG